MPGPNTTGTNDPTSYVLGRGILYAALLAAGTSKPMGYRDLGNSPDFAITIEGEELTHEASRTGLKFVDKAITLRQAVRGSFGLDEFSDQNLALVMSGDSPALVNAAVNGFTVYAMVPNGSTLARGQWFDLVNSSGLRAYGVLAANLTVTTNAATPIAMVLNTDYTLDAEMGRIFILTTSSVAATAIGLGVGLRVALGSALAKEVTQVVALTRSVIRVALKFVLDNPAGDGRKVEFEFASVKITANGDLALIGDDWGKMAFNYTAESGTFADGTTGTLRTRTLAA